MSVTKAISLLNDALEMGVKGPGAECIEPALEALQADHDQRRERFAKAAKRLKPRRLQIKHSGSLDIEVEATIIGKGEYSGMREKHLPREEWNRGTVVSIYLTTTGRFITSVYQFDHRHGIETHRAGVHDSPEDALSWLEEDSGGKGLGAASLWAWKDACKRIPEMAGLDTRKVS